MNQYGNNIAKFVRQSSVKTNPSSWTLLASGPAGETFANLTGRSYVQIQARGAGALALEFANINADGTFTTPTKTAHSSMIIPANTIMTFPLSDQVALYGRYVAKINSSAGGMKVVVAEYQ